MDSWTPGYDDNGSSSLASDDRDEPSITGGNNTSNVDEIYRLDKKTFKSMVELHREGNKTHEAPQNNEMQNSTCESENDTRSSPDTDNVVPQPKPRKLPVDPKMHLYARVFPDDIQMTTKEQSNSRRNETSAFGGTCQSSKHSDIPNDQEYDGNGSSSKSLASDDRDTRDVSSTTGEKPKAENMKDAKSNWVSPKSTYELNDKNDKATQTTETQNFARESKNDNISSPVRCTEMQFAENTGVSQTKPLKLPEDRKTDGFSRASHDNFQMTREEQSKSRRHESSASGGTYQPSKHSDIPNEPEFNDNGSSSKSLASDGRDTRDVSSTTGENNTAIDEHDDNVYKILAEMLSAGNMKDTDCLLDPNLCKTLVEMLRAENMKNTKSTLIDKSDKTSETQNVARESKNDNRSSPVRCTESQLAEDIGVCHLKPGPNTNSFAVTVSKKDVIVPASDGPGQSSTSQSEVLQYDKKSETQNVARESRNDNRSSPVRCTKGQLAEDTGVSHTKPGPNTNSFSDTVSKKDGIVPISDVKDQASTSQNEILPYEKRSDKTKTKKQTGKLESSDSQNTKKTAKYPIIQTFGDALKFFDLYSRLQLFEISLEDVRRHRKTKGAHEAELKRFDKELQKLSFKYHPDKVKNRGGSDEDIARAQNLQTALNATRTILSVLNEMFLEDINMDHRFQYYTRFDIGSMGNEDEIKNHVYEVLFKISFISEIKQQEIITEIQQFLIEGKKCVQYFLDKNFPGFQKSHYLALFHLKCCIKGYKKLIAEFNEVEQECRDDDLDCMSELLRKMESESSRNFYLLRAIKKNAKKSLHGSYQFFSTTEPLDEYYVLPFASYCNVLAMCSTVMKSRSQLTYLWNLVVSHPEPVLNDNTLPLIPLHYFASFYSGNNNYGYIVEPILYDKPLTDEAIREEFTTHLRQSNNYLEEKFKISDYHVDNIQRNLIVEQYKKCRELMADFKAKAAEMKDDIEKMKMKTKKMDDRCDLTIEENEELLRKGAEQLARSRLQRQAHCPE